MKLLFHIHTLHSYDCLIKPSFIIDYAVKNAIEVVAITDHESLKGSIEAANYALSKKNNIQAIIGAEYYTDCGDVIGLFLKDELKERNAVKLIDEIHNQGGIAILPHPYKGHKLNKEIIQRIDVIEIFNSRCTIEQNQLALGLSKQYNKPGIVGNDAHLKKELDLCHNVLKTLPLKKAILEEKQYFQSYTTKINVINSQLIKGYKKKDIVLILKMCKSSLSFYVFQPLRNLLKRNNK